MTRTWAHVSSDLARSLLEGRAPADKDNLRKVLDGMIDEQSKDAGNMLIPEKVWFGRDDALDRAHQHYIHGDIALCMNQIKTFYLT
jgi:hypothetical protein